MEEGQRPNPLERMFSRDLLMTPKMLDRIHTWSTNDKPITLREYLSARAPKAAEVLGIEQVENPNIVDAHQLDGEALRKITLEIYLLGDRNSGLAIWGRGSFTRDEMIEDLKGEYYERYSRRVNADA